MTQCVEDQMWWFCCVISLDMHIYHSSKWDKMMFKISWGHAISKLFGKCLMGNNKCLRNKVYVYVSIRSLAWNSRLEFLNTFSGCYLEQYPIPMKLPCVESYEGDCMPHYQNKRLWNLSKYQSIHSRHWKISFGKCWSYYLDFLCFCNVLSGLFDFFVLLKRCFWCDSIIAPHSIPAWAPLVIPSVGHTKRD